MSEEPEVQVTLKKVESNPTEATVDDITITQTSGPKAMTREQAERLVKSTGVKIDIEELDGRTAAQRLEQESSLEVLQSKARSAGLPTGGTKAELAERIVDHGDNNDDEETP